MFISSSLTGLLQLFYRNTYFLACSICVLLFPSLGKGQANESFSKDGFSLSPGIGVGYIQMNDAQFSSLVYKGIAPVYTLYSGYGKAKNLHQLNASYSGGEARAENFSETTLKYQYFNFEYLFARRLSRQESNWNNMAGAGLSYSSSERVYDGFINHNSNYEKFISVNGLFHSGYSFANSGWCISEQIMVSICSMVFYPSNGLDNSTSEGNKTMNSKLLWIPDMLSLKATTQLEKSISSGSYLAINYSWNAYSLASAFPVKQAIHQMSLLYKFSF